MKKAVRPVATAFQERVYDAVSRIPFGFAASYMELAREVECGSPRAVGQALRRCPYSRVPCHRVVASDGSIGGFGGEDMGPEIRKKIRLLRQEGIPVGRDGKIPADRMFRFRNYFKG